MTEDWKNQPAPSATSAVLWRHQDGELRTYTCAGALWYPTGSSYGCPWSELLLNIDMCGDGVPPKIVELAKPEAPESKPERVVVWKTGDPLDNLLPYPRDPRSVGFVALRRELRHSLEKERGAALPEQAEAAA